MLERLFKSKTTVRTLELLLFGKPIHIREIARRISITPIYVKKELEGLEKLGLVLNKKVGNLSIWEINRKSPVYHEIKSLFLKTESLGSYLQDAFGKAQVEFAMIYGSFASGTEKPESDIDLFMVGKIDEDELIRLVSKAERKINREINYVIWTKTEFIENAKNRNHLLANILKNPVIWIKGDENEFRAAVE